MRFRLPMGYFMEIAVLLIIFIVLVLFWVPFRVVVTHPVSTPIYAFYDLYHYFKHKKYNLYKAGKLDCYVAHFGGGKTLSIVSYVMALYHRYNNRLVFDDKMNCFVTQKIHILSNVDFLTVPFTPLVGLDQVVNFCMYNKELDKETKCRTCIIVVIDEASSQLNSRNFKSNIDPDFLNTLITSRHYHMSILYSSQKFKLTDKLLRDVTQRVIHCKKIWRILIQYEYDADDLEFASDPSLVRPRARFGYFLRNKNFRAYDTLATVSRLKKDVEDGNMLTSQEILALRDNTPSDSDRIDRPSRKLRLRRKKKTA